VPLPEQDSTHQARRQHGESGTGESLPPVRVAKRGQRLARADGLEGEDDVGHARWPFPWSLGHHPGDEIGE
jgi:hypothetical protein